MHPNQKHHLLLFQVLRQVQLLLNQFIMYKAMMMTSGQHLLSLILSSLKSKNSYKKFVNKNLRKKWKDSLINSSKKKRERNNIRNNKNMNTSNFKINKLRHMIKEKKKRKNNIKRKFNNKRKWEISKLKMKTNVKNNRKKEKTNLIIFWLRKSNNS